jgi:hypothetical protein
MTDRGRGTAAAAVLVAAMTALPVAAQDALDEGAARRMLFDAQRAEVVVYPQGFLSEAEAQVLRDTAARAIPYYGAIAASPSQGLAAEPTSAAGNHHDVAAAGRIALAECDAKRPSGTAPCVVVAEVRPRGWQARPLQLSSGATATFRGDFRRGGGEKSFALSPSTGGFGVGRGVGADASALAACASASRAADCRVVVRD